MNLSISQSLNQVYSSISDRELSAHEVAVASARARVDGSGEPPPPPSPTELSTALRSAALHQAAASLTKAP
jgi:hypothetical protein